MREDEGGRRRLSGKRIRCVKFCSDNLLRPLCRRRFLRSPPVAAVGRAFCCFSPACAPIFFLTRVQYIRTLFLEGQEVECRPERTISLEALRRRIARLESGAKRHGGDRPVSSGCETLDGLLPERGFCRGTLVEWLSAAGGGACTLALLAAKHACSDGRMLAVFDHRREFCPPAAVRLGIEPEQLLVIHADSAADDHWAIDQALRSQAVAAGWLGRAGSMIGPSAVGNWPPKRAAAWGCCSARKRPEANPPGRTCGCRLGRCRPPHRCEAASGC